MKGNKPLAAAKLGIALILLMFSTQPLDITINMPFQSFLILNTAE